MLPAMNDAWCALAYAARPTGRRAGAGAGPRPGAGAGPRRRADPDPDDPAAFAAARAGHAGGGRDRVGDPLLRSGVRPPLSSRRSSCAATTRPRPISSRARSTCAPATRSAPPTTASRRPASGCCRWATSWTCACRWGAAASAAAPCCSSRSRSAARSSSTSSSPPPAPPRPSGAAPTPPRPTSSAAASTWARASSRRRRPRSPGADRRPRAAAARVAARDGGAGLSLAATGLYNDGSEFYRAGGADDDADPAKLRRRPHAAAPAACWAPGKDVRPLRPPVRRRARGGGQRAYPAATLRTLRRRLLAADRLRRPAGRQPGRLAGRHRSTSTPARIPVLPRSGGRLVASVEGAHAALGSSYDFVKARRCRRPSTSAMPRGHALGFHLFGGAIVGDAPYFDRFFVGDLNLLLPRRALGINFSTLPSRDLLGTDIAAPPLRRLRGARAGRVRDPDLAAPRLRLRRRRLRGRRPVRHGQQGGLRRRPAACAWRNLPIDLTGDLGLRLDTYVGVFTISIANALSRSSF